MNPVPLQARHGVENCIIPPAFISTPLPRQVEQTCCFLDGSKPDPEQVVQGS
jgi:hypothetical protein